MFTFTFGDFCFSFFLHFLFYLFFTKKTFYEIKTYIDNPAFKQLLPELESRSQKFKYRCFHVKSPLLGTFIWLKKGGGGLIVPTRCLVFCLKPIFNLHPILAKKEGGDLE